MWFAAAAHDGTLADRSRGIRAIEAQNTRIFAGFSQFSNLEVDMITVQESPRPVILVDSREAARLLAISPRTLWQLTKLGTVPSIRIGRSVRYRVADLDNWAKKQTESV